MHDDKDQISNEDEYQFPEDEFIQGESTGRPSIEAEESLEQEAKNAQRARIMKIYNSIREVLANRIVAAVIIVIFLLILAHFFFGNSSKKQAAPVQQTPVQQPVQIAQPSNQVLSELTGIKQSANTTHDTVAQLQSQIQSLQSSISEMSQTRQQYEGALTDLSKKLNAVAAQQQKLMTVQTKKTTKAHKKPVIVIPPVDFYTRAVVHNRAWVIGSNGMNASISVGDHLRDYGKVISINANTGSIKTSSGRTIAYAPGDQ